MMYFTGQDDDGHIYATPGSSYFKDGIQRVLYQFDTGAFYIRFASRITGIYTKQHILDGIHTDSELSKLSEDTQDKLLRFVGHFQINEDSCQDIIMPRYPYDPIIRYHI